LFSGRCGRCNQLRWIWVMAMVMVDCARGRKAGRWVLRRTAGGWRSCQSGAEFFLQYGGALFTVRVDMLKILPYRLRKLSLYEGDVSSGLNFKWYQRGKVRKQRALIARISYGHFHADSLVWVVPLYDKILGLPAVDTPALLPRNLQLRKIPWLPFQLRL